MNNHTHTFLFQEAIWQAKGIYFDTDNNEYEMEGMAQISHKEKLWINEGFMKIHSELHKDFFNFYEIKPFDEKVDYTTWKSYNPTLGLMKGKFMLADDVIISTFTSEFSNYSGVEYLMKKDNFTYNSIGFTFAGEKKLSSWKIVLKKTNQNG